MKILSPAQADIMLAVWDAEKPVTRNDLQEILVEKKWKTTTLNTHLSKLVEYDFLKIEHRGREYVYHPLISKKDYLAYEGNSVLKKLYGNSMNNFLAAISYSRKISKEEVQELQQFLDQLKEE